MTQHLVLVRNMATEEVREVTVDASNSQDAHIAASAAHGMRVLRWRRSTTVVVPPEQFHMECQFIRERNPDMTDDQIGQHVLGRWYHRMERERREVS